MAPDWQIGFLSFSLGQAHVEEGVPTFLAGDQAVFVRLMNGATAGSGPVVSVRAIERTVDLLTGWTDLNEFEHTSIPR